MTILPVRCSCCPRMVGQFVRREDGTIGLVLVARHDKNEKHVTFWTAEQLKQILNDLEHEQVDSTEHNVLL